MYHTKLKNAYFQIESLLKDLSEDERIQLLARLLNRQHFLKAMGFDVVILEGDIGPSAYLRAKISKDGITYPIQNIFDINFVEFINEHKRLVKLNEDLKILKGETK